MTSIVDIYTIAVHDNLRPLRANWEPTQPIKLGDYGVLARHAFQRIGNVADQNIKIGKVTNDNIGDQKIFSSSGKTTLTFHAKGSSATNPAVIVNANLEISFSAEDAAFFNAAECSYSIIDNKAALGTQIMKAHKARSWQREWAVVTDLVTAKSTTIVISGATSGSIVLEASGNVTQIDLANANIGLTLNSARNVGYQVIAQKNLVPLIGLSKIQSDFLGWDDKFKPLSSQMMSNWQQVVNMQNSEGIKTEKDDEIHFRQLY